jgi:hypothetical protein
MSATTRPATDAPQGQGEDFNAVFAEMTAARDTEPAAGQGEPARQEPPATPEAEDEGRQTPPRDERGRFTAPQQETQAPPTQEPTTPEQPAEPPADPAAQLAAERARREELERTYSANVEQLRRQAQAYQQQLQQGEQTWRQNQEQRIAVERDRLRRDLDLRIARSPEATAEQIQEARDLLEGRFAIEDLARERAERQAERQGWQQTLAGLQQQDQHRRVSDVVPSVLTKYATQMAARAQALHGVSVAPEEAAAFVAEPHIREQYERAWVLPIPPEAKEALVDAIETQQVALLAQRSRLATERREFEQQQQLATNRANAAGNGATRELVPGSAGPTDPDLARFQSRPGNEGDHFDALWAATRQEQ